MRGSEGSRTSSALAAPLGCGRVERQAPAQRTATRYVTPLREGGSLPGLVEADDSGLYVVKFRGAGQGPARWWPR